jgi:hypothetical protein
VQQEIKGAIKKIELDLKKSRKLLGCRHGVRTLGHLRALITLNYFNQLILSMGILWGLSENRRSQEKNPQ